MDEAKFSHIDSHGNANMVDVGDKLMTDRMAIARGQIKMQHSTFTLLEQGLMKKGDVLTVAQIAGIQAAKKTSELIPLCHPLIINQIDVQLTLNMELPGVVIEAMVRTNGKTGVEMEALTAVSVAALTVYDMIKAVEKGAVIENIRLIQKRGGKSGDINLE
ncbi:MAG: cyclic pyranopterin monophosphate synthase MoaC [Chloroflexi bacterium HGW-Chloroflexi-10]|nr:MAG: cyclic pyranopterin monophosphate synthase MoaC [Chloroflexi bacterium HGW-Chloroflexi-10]